MNYRAFGNTGIRVSDLILGTWYLPNSGTKTKPQVDRETSLKLIRKAYDLGINFFDTADVYRGVYDRVNMQGNFKTVGLSEKILGEALKGYDRESFVVATKVMGRTGALQNDLGLNRKHVRSAIVKSLERLQMDYVDFYLMHAPDGVTGRYESAKSMNLLIEDGKILHYGLSNFESHEIVNMYASGYSIVKQLRKLYDQSSCQYETNSSEACIRAWFDCRVWIWCFRSYNLYGHRSKDNGESASAGIFLSKRCIDLLPALLYRQ